ncbi:cytochrome P450 [Pseudonocardia sediminis]|uniref:Cytochrome P450 n=1 Tax=Pseudonocardia sediminis TaxID=1397368 RepID=A0A4Q7UVZ3_PSEST|nr:cytochrome P450 [Pseudonocardia sediminis]RZT85996.1 cytochrome P450 [Pseudonocardia sediminis]
MTAHPTRRADRWERRVQLAAHPLGYPLLRGLARLGPVVRVPRVGVVVSDAAVARAVLGDPSAFRKTGPGSPAALWTPVVGPSVLLNMEGPDHARLRTALSELFTPRAVEELVAASAVPELVRRRLVAGEEVDLVAATASMAGAAIAELVGLGEPAETRTGASGRGGTAAGPARADTRSGGFGPPGPALDAARALTGMVRLGRPSLTTRQVTRARAALATLTAPAVAAYREGDPSTVPGRMRALGLDEEEARGAVAAFALTGTETVVSFVPRLVALVHDAGLLDAVAADPDTAETVTTEALRVVAPSPVMLRSVARPGVVGDTEVRPGDRVVIATVSAARATGGFDPQRPHPPAVRNLWFGAGPHFCLGMPLATAQIRALRTAVLDAHRERPVRVLRRRVARQVLVPGYRELVVGHG